MTQFECEGSILQIPKILTACSVINDMQCVENCTKLAKFVSDPMWSSLRSKEVHTLVWKPNIRTLEPFSWTGPVSAFLHEFLHPL